MWWLHVMSFEKLTPGYFPPAPSHRCGMGAVCCFHLVRTRISKVGWVKMQRPVWFIAQEVFYLGYKCIPKIILDQVLFLWAMGVRGKRKWSSISTRVVFCQTGNSGSSWAGCSIHRNVPIQATSCVGHCQMLLPATWVLMTRSWIVVINWDS